MPESDEGIQPNRKTEATRRNDNGAAGYLDGRHPALQNSLPAPLRLLHSPNG